MQILFAISIVSFLVLVWAAVAITRRVRASHKLERASTPPQPDFSQFLFAAAEGENVPPSPVQHQTARDISADLGWTISPTESLMNSYDQTISSKRL